MKMKIAVRLSEISIESIHTFVLRTDTDYQVSTRRISVQSSFKLKLPPPLIIEASSIKVADPIGQGSIA